MQQGVDSRALFAVFVTKLPRLLVLAVAGAVLGSGLRLMIVGIQMQESCYVSETEYYVAFADGQDEARHWYNDFTWNDVIATDLILGRAMEILGGGYERNQVKEMITADILSDVRYLTITVKGRDAAQVEAVKDALVTALEEFGAAKKEFASIEKIEDQAIAREEIPYFTWRAALLGAVALAGAGVFVTAFSFCMGSVFYTKNDIVTRLGIPVCGMTFRGGHRAGAGGAMEQRQAKMLEESLRRLAETHAQILLMDACGGQEAAALLGELEKAGWTDGSKFGLYSVEDGWKHTGADTVVVAVVLFGQPYREKIADEIAFVRMHGGSVSAAVLAGADRLWMRIYYAQGLWAQREA